MLKQVCNDRNKYVDFMYNLNCFSVEYSMNKDRKWQLLDLKTSATLQKLLADQSVMIKRCTVLLLPITD